MFLALAPAGASAGVRGLVPFPTNLLTTPDSSQLTGIRVELPKPDCGTQAGTCADVDVLNALDGFNAQPRISIPFSGPIDVSTVSDSTVHLLDTSCPACAPIGINQFAWEPSANTPFTWSPTSLKQHTTYLVVATTGLEDDEGQPVDRTSFQRELNFGQTGEAAAKAYRKALVDALDAAGVDLEHVVAASLFTTQSVTADLEKIHRQIDDSSPAPASILGSFDCTGIATIAINVVGHGGGADVTLTINQVVGSPVTIPAGGRGIDQTGDARIDSTEGVSAASQFGLVSNRDGAAPDGRQPDAARPPDPGRRHRRSRPVTHLLLRPVVRRHLQDGLPRRGARRGRGRAERAGRARRGDLAALAERPPAARPGAVQPHAAALQRRPERHVHELRREPAIAQPAAGRRYRRGPGRSRSSSIAPSGRSWRRTRSPMRRTCARRPSPACRQSR